MTVTSQERQERHFRNLHVRFSIRFSYLLFPFDIVELVERLAKAGYQITIPRPPKIPGKNVRLGATGKIAQKGDVEIDINDDRGILGAASSSPASSIEGLNEVLQLINTNLNVDLYEVAAFYELIGHFDIESDQNPLEKIEQISQKGTHIKQFNDILNEDVSDYTLRLVPRGRIPNQTEWFDITIQPNVIKPFSSYTVTVVYRSKDRSRVEEFIRDLLQNMNRIINVIES